MRPVAAEELKIPDFVPECDAQRMRRDYAAAIHRVYKRAIKELLPDSDMFEDLPKPDIRIVYHPVVHADFSAVADSYQVFWDSRMDDVWRELKRKDKGAYRYKPRLPFVGDAKERQEAAMLEVLRTAFDCHHLSFVDNLQTQAEDEDKESDYSDIADRLERSISPESRWQDVFPALLQTSTFDEEDVKKGLDAIRAHERDDEQIRQVVRILRYRARMNFLARPDRPERKHRGDVPGRLVALTLADKFHDLFGQPLLGQTATIASVVLGREDEQAITPENVASWIRRRKRAEVGGNLRPVRKPPKKVR
jgi:hypothetical protein